MTQPDASCGCLDFEVSRRSFLRGAAAAAGAGILSSVTGSAFTQASFGAAAGGNVLVVLSLRGGADGLSLVVPHGDPQYAIVRPKIAIPGPSLIAKKELFGLHPGFAPLLPMWTRGELAAVHAVGLPSPNRSHFAAMEEVEDADPGSAERRGWLNRMVGLNAVTSPLDAVQIGSAMVPGSLYGPTPVLAVGKLDDMEIAGREDLEGRARRQASLHAAWDPAPGVLGRGGRAALSTAAAFKGIAGQATQPQNGATYPLGDLGDALAETARLLRAEVGVQVVTVDYGNWDMHVGLGNLTGGAMIGMVDELARALAAFFTDLGTLRSRVTLLTLTEFGRRVAENANAGLDHGYGQAMLVAGAGVRGGQYYGRWPGLDNLVEGDLRVTRDYRSVLTEVLRARFDVDTSKVFPGFQPEAPLGLAA